MVRYKYKVYKNEKSYFKSHRFWKSRLDNKIKKII